MHILAFILMFVFGAIGAAIKMPSIPSPNELVAIKIFFLLLKNSF